MRFDSYNKIVGETEEFKKFSDEFDYNIEFLEDFSELIKFSGRIISFITNSNIHYINTNLLDNSIQTLRSIKLCCSIGSFADANTLIRRLRDDLLLFVYILEVVNGRKSFIEKDLENLNLSSKEMFTESFSNLALNPILTDDEKAVEAWLTNKVSELSREVKKKISFENYITFLKKNQNLIKILVDYNLQEYWKTLSKNLNNYVHNNGRKFTADNLVKHNNEDLKVYLNNINIRSSYITTFFLVLLTMVESALISSTDMIDYLDCDIEPPKDCQYEIAPFIQKYIDNKVVKLHPCLKAFLNDKNSHGMKIQ